MTESETGSIGKEQCVCPIGKYGTDFKCTLCPPGTFLDRIGGRIESDCIPCPAGTYKVHSGAGPCLPADSGYFANQGVTAQTKCPTMSSTKFIASKTLVDCLCPPGYYGDAEISCSICPNE